MKIIYSENKATYLVLTGVAIVIISGCIFLFKGSWIYDVNSEIEESKIGAFGDFIAGIVGTIFSLAGIILFYVALNEQRKDIKTNEEALKNQIQIFNQQISEFEFQRKELAETRKVYEEQTKTLKSQRFEETFYSYMNVFIERRKQLSADDYNEYFRGIANRLNIQGLNPGFVGLEKIKKLYEDVYIESRSQLASYFIIFYRLLKMIELSGIDDKEIYHKILRSIISKDELLVLYYNYHSRFGQKPIPIALKYEYFKHLEKLAKFELKVFVKPNDSLFELNNLADTLSETVINCIKKAKNLDEDDIILELLISPGAFVRIAISNELIIDFITDSDVHQLFDRSIEEFLILFEHLLIDIIYSSYFSSFVIENLKRSTTIERNQKIESFKFTNISHIS